MESYFPIHWALLSDWDAGRESRRTWLRLEYILFRRVSRFRLGGHQPTALVCIRCSSRCLGGRRRRRSRACRQPILGEAEIWRADDQGVMRSVWRAASGRSADSVLRVSAWGVHERRESGGSGKIARRNPVGLGTTPATSTIQWLRNGQTHWYRQANTHHPYVVRGYRPYRDPNPAYPADYITGDGCE